MARDAVAALLPPGGTLSFTSGATEALNWAIQGSTGPIVTWATEHAAVLDTVAAEARKGRAVTLLPVGEDGLVDLAAARAAITPGTGLVAAMLVNNEIGVIQPIAELAALAHEAGALFLCDAVQGYGRVPVPEGCDLVAVSAHKIHGPKGIGALWVRGGVPLAPLLHGGGQEPGGRSGTLSPALCAGFGAAATLAATRREADAAHVARLFETACERLHLAPLPAREGPHLAPLPAREGLGVGGEQSEPPAAAVRPPPSAPAPTPDPSLAGSDNRIGQQEPINAVIPAKAGIQLAAPLDEEAQTEHRMDPDFRQDDKELSHMRLPSLAGRGEAEWHLNGSPSARYPGNLNLRRDGLDVARLMSDLRDIAFSAGSACASGSGRPSHVLRALGLSDAQARSSIRLGFGRYTTEGEVMEAIDRIEAAARAQQAAA
ncbi:cysteine desulfurase family protein [Sphingomonas hengshuiensis]|uniref:cysteine desulfurase family protein n=1 Tax=Sphingomonas hengshuiensis TaxID=1609977 RepID=UPI0022350693|nr:aminotransferase class V-fold PLP-dependent enzyme [Sphingomonas hengshuiensis]